MRLVFMGTSDFALVALRALHGAGHEIACVYSQPPRPAGRGRRTRPGPVHAWALERALPVRTPVSLRPEPEKRRFAALKPDVAVVASYGLILPGAFLDAPRHGCINIHASLLPRWRGAAPIQRAILAGDAQTGVTVMRMEKGLDTGPAILTDRMAIGPAATGGELHDALAHMGGRLILKVLADLPGYAARAVPQPDDGVTYAGKLEKNEGALDWTCPAADLARRIRALTPWPGAFFMRGKERFRVFEAEVVAMTGVPGTVLDERITIACARDALRPIRLQRAGRSPMTTRELLRGYDGLAAGTVLE